LSDTVSRHTLAKSAPGRGARGAAAENTRLMSNKAGRRNVAGMKAEKQTMSKPYPETDLTQKKIHRGQPCPAERVITANNRNINAAKQKQKQQEQEQEEPETPERKTA